MKVYYFSGTGNCLAAAKQIAANIDNCEIYSIAQEIKNDKIIIESETAVIIFPVYAYDMPGLVHKFIKRAEFKCKYIAAIATYASKFGAALLKTKKLLRKKGSTLNYSAAIKTVENYIPIFGVPKNDYIAKRLKLQSAKIDEVIADIKTKKQNIPKKKFFGGYIISILFRMFKWVFPLFYRTTKDCNGCGQCVNICPAGAIKLNRKRRPDFSCKCAQCQACFNWCPVKAIKFLRYKKKSGRYTHPDVKITEINK